MEGSASKSVSKPLGVESPSAVHSGRPWALRGFAIFATALMILVALEAQVVSGAFEAVPAPDEDDSGAEPRRVDDDQAGTRGAVIAQPDANQSSPLPPGRVHSTFTEYPVSRAEVSNWTWEPYLSERSHAYLYTTVTGIYEFPRSHEHRMQAQDLEGTPLAYESFFTVALSPAQASADELASAVRPNVTVARSSRFVVRYDIEKGSTVVGLMEVAVDFRADRSPKISARFEPLANGSSALDNASASIVWSLRVPVGVLYGDSKPVDLSLISDPRTLPYVRSRVRIEPRDGRRPVVIDWSDTPLLATVWVEPGVPDGPDPNVRLFVRFPGGVFTVDPTIQGSQSEYATAYSSQRKVFLHNGLYWAFWYDYAIRYGWSTDGTDGTWHLGTVPGIAASPGSFDVAMLGDVVGIAYYITYWMGVRFVRGQVLNQAITWADPVLVDDSTAPLHHPVSVAISPVAGVFVATVSSNLGASQEFVRIYRSTTGGSTWTKDIESPTGPEYIDIWTVPMLSTATNGSVYALWVSRDDADLRWRWFGPGSWSSERIASLGLTLGVGREPRVSVVAGDDDSAHVFYVDVAGPWNFLEHATVRETEFAGTEPVHSTMASVARTGR